MKRKFIDKLLQEKQEISNFLLNFIEKEENKYQDQRLSSEVFGKIRKFAVAGKMARGSLFLMGAKSFDKKINDNHLRIATALELIHSGLLTHDDIIDQDQKRRGQESVWQEFTNKAQEKNYKNSQNYGESIAICTANICYYLANSILEELENLDDETKNEIKKTINQEIIKVNFAEMLDVQISLEKKDPKLEDILNMYQYKTARYTFSLPLILAGLISQKETAFIQELAKIGENLGLIFQIKDDHIGIFADEKTSGKTAASDIKEAKKTIFYYFLKKEIAEKEKKEFFEIFGKKDLKEEEIELAQKLFEKYSSKQVDEIISQLETMAKLDISKINNKKTKEILEGILDFNLNREN